MATSFDGLLLSQMVERVLQCVKRCRSGRQRNLLAAYLLCHQLCEHSMPIHVGMNRVAHHQHPSRRIVVTHLLPRSETIDQMQV